MQALASVVIFCLICVASCARINDVNLYIGTGGHGYGIGGLPVGAQSPYGKVRLSPDSTHSEEIWIPWSHTGGYYYADTHIRMFTHTHCVGAGVIDYGTTGNMPTCQLPIKIGTGEIDRYPFIQSFSHANETAQPGFYSVYFPDSQINVELTTTENVGFHRYEWRATENCGNYIVFDTSYTLKHLGSGGSQIAIDTANNEVNGMVLNLGSLSARFGGVKVYFVAHFNETLTGYGVWDDSGFFHKNTAQMNGTNIGGYVSFQSDVVEMYVGISFISIDQARYNLEQTLANFTATTSPVFDQVKANTQNIWENLLNIVQINDEGPLSQQDNITVFYTALYHTLTSPTRFSEVGGVYLGFDGQVHQVGDNAQFPMANYYTDMSIWDTFRTQFPWLTLMQRDVMKDIAQSLVTMYQQGGDLPRWPLANGYTNTMIGTHADIVLAEALAHQLVFDYNTAYAGMYQGATEPQAYAGRSDIQGYIELGYVPVDQSSTGCSETLEYAYDDWCCALFAKYLGKDSDYEMFYNRSFNFVNQFNHTNQFMCPRYSDGTWDCPRDLTWTADKRYVEGDAWHWRWFAPQHGDRLVELFSSVDYFVDQLNEFFQKSFTDLLSPANILPNPYYWAGNEHDLFSVYQFVYAQRNDLTQYWVRQLLAKHYPNTPAGLSGNDDYGALSAWAVFGYLGLYPRPGDGTYVLGIPYFANVTLQRDVGDINILAYNLSPENIYVSQVAVNGVKLATPFVNISQILNGGTIEFWLTSTATPIYTQ